MPTMILTRTTPTGVNEEKLTFEQSWEEPDAIVLKGYDAAEQAVMLRIDKSTALTAVFGDVGSIVAH